MSHLPVVAIKTVKELQVDGAEEAVLSFVVLVVVLVILKNVLHEQARHVVAGK